MKSEKSNTRLWTAVAALNVIALTYPVRLLLNANSADENLVAAFTFIGVIFLLVVLDALSIVIADTFITTKAKAGRSAAEAHVTKAVREKNYD